MHQYREQGHDRITNRNATPEPEAFSRQQAVRDNPAAGQQQRYDGGQSNRQHEENQAGGNPQWSVRKATPGPDAFRNHHDQIAGHNQNGNQGIGIHGFTSTPRWTLMH